MLKHCRRGPIASSAMADAYELLFNHVETMVCTLDLEGRFTSINPAGERLTGHPAAELLGLTALDLIAAEPPGGCRGELPAAHLR